MPTLDWLNRAAAFQTAARVPYRLLEPVSAHGDGDARNLLIQGDNLEALKALLPLQRGQVKCIFIDPPYNTKSAFEHYDDNLEHAQWLSMMLPRLQLLRELLRDDGSIWVTIDDNEGHYLKVLMDEVFGRGNFVDDRCLAESAIRRDNNCASVFVDVSRLHALCMRAILTRIGQARNRVEPDGTNAMKPTRIYTNSRSERRPGVRGSRVILVQPFKPYSKGQFAMADSERPNLSIRSPGQVLAPYLEETAS